MAKISKSLSFKNCVIDINDGTITEYTKDGENVYNLKNILSEWNGVDGISFNLKQDDELEPEQVGSDY